MKRILCVVALFGLVFCATAADLSGEYPIALAVYPSGSFLVFSTERTQAYCSECDFPITLEPQMIQKAKFWKEEWHELECGRMVKVSVRRSIKPELAAQFAKFIPGTSVKVGLEIHLHSPETRKK